MSSSGTRTTESLSPKLRSQKPFSLLPSDVLDSWFQNAELLGFAVGSTIVRSDELPESVLLLTKGQVRLLVPAGAGYGWQTLCKRGPGQFIGSASLLRAEPCELVIASEPCTLLALPAAQFIELVNTHSDFADFFSVAANVQEAYIVASAAEALLPLRHDAWADYLKIATLKSRSLCVEQGATFRPPTTPKNEGPVTWYMSTAGIDGMPVGTQIEQGARLPIREGFNLRLRLIGIPVDASITLEQTHSLDTEPVGSSEVKPTSLDQLGIVDSKTLTESDRYPLVKGKGSLQEAMAVIEMLCLYKRVTFRRDGIQKVLEGQFARDKGLSIELLAGLCELLGFNTNLADVDIKFINSLETPALLIAGATPCILYGSDKGCSIIGHPGMGLIRRSLHEMQVLCETETKVRVVLPKRISTTPTSRFGWSWFTPLLKKYKWALVMVFIASLLAQLFSLAIPLLLQQIIDKVLTQGNLSSLNVLGAAMVVMALFKGILMALRTYIFVDTTDRMDLTLGSAVIDRLLALPLTYFEKRPVGELAQRLGELNNIRSFLTGTALISVLNIIFATTYLVVMIIYSPLLTAVALSTLPFYLLMVFVVSPVYKAMIRRRAIAQASTQSHLIEVIGGIQTVKAQHFELTARWKWQDKYRHYVEEGFKSTALSASTSEVGAFLNQLSSLLVLWVGMWLVLQGQFTLGMLIAFRIIAGNVTGPLMQLSGLYQGFQGVQLSMERLSDILDQNPEIGTYDTDLGQISLPVIKGNVLFEHVKFGFKPNSPPQVDDVTISIPAGSFVGIVGQSGSGKSTLMKLLPRLYDPQFGRIFIDNYDISKVDLSSLRRQIGIVPQDSLLFEGTVGENIALNDPLASNEAILEAASIACAHEFIMELGKGYATQLVEKGANLSGGQRQRIAIARTVLSNPQLLVMDEATSALDFNTERLLCANLQKWARGRTVFFITHRLSTVRSSDIILVMHQGRLVESGAHDELMALQGRYYALYRQQDQQS